MSPSLQRYAGCPLQTGASSRRQWPWRTLEAVEYATLAWVDWFNHRRLLEPIGFVPPAEAEAAFYQRLEIDRRAA